MRNKWNIILDRGFCALCVNRFLTNIHKNNCTNTNAEKRTSEATFCMLPCFKPDWTIFNIWTFDVFFVVRSWCRQNSLEKRRSIDNLNEYNYVALKAIKRSHTNTIITITSLRSAFLIVISLDDAFLFKSDEIQMNYQWPRLVCA